MIGNKSRFQLEKQPFDAIAFQGPQHRVRCTKKCTEKTVYAGRYVCVCVCTVHLYEYIWTLYMTVSVAYHNRANFIFRFVVERVCYCAKILTYQISYACALNLWVCLHIDKLQMYFCVLGFAISQQTHHKSLYWR